MRMGFMIAALLLAGCATKPDHYDSPRYWVDFRAARIELTTNGATQAHRSAPYSVINAYAVCATDYALTALTPEERSTLDAFAQNKRSLSAAEFDSLDAKLRAAGSYDFTLDNVDRLNNTCPDKVPLFKQYLKP